MKIKILFILIILSIVVLIITISTVGVAHSQVAPREFLVRLEDKVNTQVFCLNPVHKGNHMDRVFFKDATFSAVCPECGSSEYLYRKNNAITKKGHFITFKPAGWSWGSNERKHYGIVRVSCTHEQAKKWCEGVRNEQAELEAKTQKDEELRKIAENTAQIDYRPRKYIFAFETVLTAGEVANWNNDKEDSKIIECATITMAE